MSADLRPCRCGADLCIQQRTLREGYRCVREAGLAALQAGSTTVQAGLRERCEQEMKAAITMNGKCIRDRLEAADIWLGEVRAYANVMTWIAAAALQEREPESAEQALTRLREEQT